jgi:hypothetical protein
MFSRLIGLDTNMPDLKDWMAKRRKFRNEMKEGKGRAKENR